MSYLNYEQMIDRALLFAVREALLQIEKEGLKGDHHFYLSFLTQYPGVLLPQDIKDAYPDEITIVLQHEFWNLVVGKDHLSVEVKFDDRLEKVSIPFQAISHVSDPSVNFELEFNPKVGNIQQFGGSFSKKENEVEEELVSGSDDKKKGTVVSLDSFRRK